MTTPAPGTDPLHQLDETTDAVDGLLAGVTADGWRCATPCAEWDVRALVNHLTTGTLMFSAMLTGAEAPDRDADNLGDDPLATYRSATATFRAAMSRPGALDATYPTAFGDETGTSVVQMRIAEHITHGWDLARATGASTDIAPDVAEGVLAHWRAGFGGVPRDGMPFDDEQPTPEDATAADRLAAFLGRQV